MTPGSTVWEKVTLFVFGAASFFILLAIASWDKNPTATSWYIYNCLLAMAAGGISALLPGALDLNWHPGIRATSAFAIAIIVFYAGKDKIKPNFKPNPAEDLNSWLVFGGGDNAPNPDQTDVFVILNHKVVKQDLVSSAPAMQRVEGNSSGDIDITRGPGGIRIDFKALNEGDSLFVALRNNSVWWKSDDMLIPEAQLQMKKADMEGIMNRISRAH